MIIRNLSQYHYHSARYFGPYFMEKIRAIGNNLSQLPFNSLNICLSSPTPLASFSLVILFPKCKIFSNLFALKQFCFIIYLLTNSIFSFLLMHITEQLVSSQMSITSSYIHLSTPCNLASVPITLQSLFLLRSLVIKPNEQFGPYSTRFFFQWIFMIILFLKSFLFPYLSWEYAHLLLLFLLSLTQFGSYITSTKHYILPCKILSTTMISSVPTYMWMISKLFNLEFHLHFRLYIPSCKYPTRVSNSTSSKWNSILKTKWAHIVYNFLLNKINSYYTP